MKIIADDTRSLQDNIQMYVRTIVLKVLDLIYGCMARGRENWMAFVNTVMIFSPTNGGEFVDCLSES
jgi:hypothetical protein